MRLNNYLRCLVAAASALALVGCVDNDFRLDETSLEVTIGDDQSTVLPLGYMDKTTLGDILDVDDIDGMTVDEQGNYSLNFSDEDKSIDIDDIQTSFDIPRTSTSFTAHFPTLNIATEPLSVHEHPQVSMNVEEYYVPGTGYVIPEGVNIPISGLFTNSCELEEAHFEVPRHIKEITSIDFQGGEYGSPVTISLDFNDLVAVNGGGTGIFTFSLTGANFVMRDKEGGTYEGNTLQKAFMFDEGEELLELEVFVESVRDLPSIENGALDVPITMEYSLTFNMETKAGSFTLDELPRLSFDTDLEYKDAGVVLDGSMPLVEYHSDAGDVISVSGLPEEVKSVNRITLEDDTLITLFAHGLDWLGNTAELVELDIILPGYLILHSIPDVHYSYNEESHMLKATLQDLNEGMQIGIEAIDFGEEGIMPVDGAIALNFAPDIVAHFVDGATTEVSALTGGDDQDVTFETGLEQTTFTVKSVSGCVDYAYLKEDVIELTELDDKLENLQIGGSGLSPVIRLDISNPLTISTVARARLVPIKEGVECEENAVEATDIVITPATYNGERVVNGVTHLIIALEERRSEYQDGDYTFVACDIDRLLKGALPDAIGFEIELATNANDVSELYLMDECKVLYGYDVDIPLAFDSSLELSYSDVASGLGDTFDELSEYNIKVGDVSLLADIANTLPLQLLCGVELLDVDGNPSVVKARIEEDMLSIDGSKDGVSEVVSRIAINLDIPDGDIRHLANIDGVRFDIKATGKAEDNVSLNKDQYVSLKLYLEVKGGVTIDLESI